MAIDIAALQTFTPADLLKLVEYNIARIHAGGQVVGVNGRTLTFADLKDLYAQRDALKAEIDTENSTETNGNVLVQLGRAQ